MWVDQEAENRLEVRLVYTPQDLSLSDTLLLWVPLSEVSPNSSISQGPGVPNQGREEIFQIEMITILILKINTKG